MRKKTTAKARFVAPTDWTFHSRELVQAFDSHVREQLPWYDLATGAVAHVARCFVPDEGSILDVGCSTGNIARALAPTIKARGARYVGIDVVEAMIDAFHKNRPAGDFCAYRCDARAHDYFQPRDDLIVCFLTLMFVPMKDREGVLLRMKQALNPGGAIVVVDKIVPRGGYASTVNHRLTLAAKYEAGATAEEIIKKELSIAGLQRPMTEGELDGFVEFFRFGEFSGLVWEKAV